MVKTKHFAFIFLLVSLTNAFSQGVASQKLFSNDFSWVANNNSFPPLYDSNRMSFLHNENTSACFASVMTQSTKTLPYINSNGVNHHPLVFAKINFFGIDNLAEDKDIDTQFKNNESSFWENDIIYFVVGAVAATALYLVWQNSESENPPQKTFGIPPKPKGAYGL